MEKRIEPLLPKGSNAGEGIELKCPTGKETAGRPHALEVIHLHCATVLLFYGRLAIMAAVLPQAPCSWIPKNCRDASL